MSRTTLVVPAQHVGSLEVPSQALDDASPVVVWLNAPTDGFCGSGRMAVPLAARSVKSAGRFLLEFRLRPFIGWLVFAAYTVMSDGYMRGLLSSVPQVVLAAALGGWLTFASNRPRQLPYRTHVGDVVVPRVHADTARRWVESNPNVRTTDDPVARPQPPLFYAVWSTVLLLGSIGVGTYLANDGREQSLAIWVAVAAVFVSGVRTALKTLPLGYIRWEPGEQS
ncbi:hypothetical protein GCM10010112_35160 [Actinoplanes lobatus]|uniref:Uncharacterized protein n=1 Tax=Actinoplanes lobatus TaxID=113568 RepID=A0A7W7MF91_9ACTN|nr:hypothetical protein [Actinoplanes lobatus]MBB4748082.1 hypothetical protein [Actinoplanes lobatus]GGN69536.1 hypothetical protein GCM10010112_35160 [Actinoplanes lobatus]GIE45772.1 hypothetical protein Alo02nite_86700 [Actinoplanes lobatus]